MDETRWQRSSAPDRSREPAPPARRRGGAHRGSCRRGRPTRGDARNRVRASRKGEKVAICHRAGDGTYHRLKVAKRAVQKHLEHGDFRFIDCCAAGECQDGETCAAGTCTPAVPCNRPGQTDPLCGSNLCGCTTETTPGSGHLHVPRRTLRGGG